MYSYGENFHQYVYGVFINTRIFKKLDSMAELCTFPMR